jgi:calcium-dependent protein kinase
MKNEVQILSELDHPNIVRVFEFYEDNNFFYIITELCIGGSLEEHLKKEKTDNFTQKHVAKIMKQLFSAIQYCHNKNITHRDLKLKNIHYENINLDSPIKIKDWGVAVCNEDGEILTKKLGTPYFIAPEVL